MRRLEDSECFHLHISSSAHKSDLGSGTTVFLMETLQPRFWTQSSFKLTSRHQSSSHTVMLNIHQLMKGVIYLKSKEILCKVPTSNCWCMPCVGVGVWTDVNMWTKFKPQTSSPMEEAAFLSIPRTECTQQPLPPQTSAISEHVRAAGFYFPCDQGCHSQLAASIAQKKKKKIRKK